MDLTNENVEEKEPPIKSRTYNDADVDRIVGAKKAELMAKHQQELERVRAENAARPANNNLDMDALTQQLSDGVYNKIVGQLKSHHEEMQRAEQEKYVKNLADQFHLKMGKDSELFDDYKDVVGKLKPEKYINTSLLAAEMDHTNEIMYELRKNPEKLLQIENAASMGDTDLAKELLERVEKSIKTNLEAKRNNQDIPAPLSEVKSSKVGVDNKERTIRDFKNAEWLRG